MTVAYYLWAFLTTFVLPMSIAGATLLARYDANETSLLTSKAWQDRMTHSGCKADDLDPATILHYRHFEHSAVMALATGVFFGQLFEHQFMANSGRLNSS